MSFNGSGTFLINTAGQPVVSGTVISSTAFNALTADLATGLSTAITKDGQTTVTANIPMSTYKFTGLGVGSAATDSANLSQVQSTVTKLLNSVSGADTITATASPTLAAYAAGQMFYFVAAGDNTTSVTLNIDALGAKAVTRDGSTALVAADIKSGEVIVVVYDGTRFQVVSQLNSAGDARFANVSIASSLYVGGVSTFVGNAGFSANVSIASALSVGGVAAITGATTIGGNLTLSGGTANGVLYLNGSKVATSGSALQFDSTQMDIGVGGYYGRLNLARSSGSPYATMTLTDPSNAANEVGIYLRATGTNPVGISSAGAPVAFYLGGPGTTESMRLTSTGLGIGTASPGARLGVTSPAATAAAAAFRSGSTDSVYLTLGRNAYEAGVGVTGSTVLLTGATAGDLNIYTSLAGAAIRFGTGNAGTIQATLDSSGNLGLGVVPSSTGSNARALQLTNYGTLSGNGNLGFMSMAANAYESADNSWNRVNATTAARYQISYTGEHSWYNAGAGIAGSAISFTQAMTLDASGNLALGGTSNKVTGLSGSGTGFTVQATAAPTIGVWDTSDASYYLQLGQIDANSYLWDIANGFLSFGTNNTERARITSGGDLLVGNTNLSGKVAAEQSATNSPGLYAFCSSASYTASVIQAQSTSTGTGYNLYRGLADVSTEVYVVRGNGNVLNTNGSYGTISDAKMKTDIVDAGSQWDDLKAVRFRKFKMKDDQSGITQLGVVAQELEQTSPGLVDEHADRDAEGNDLGTTTKSVKSSILLMKAAKALQEAMARIETLEAKVTALESK